MKKIINFGAKNQKFIIFGLAGVVFIISIVYLNHASFLNNQIAKLYNSKSILEKQLKAIELDIKELKNQDQYKINRALEEEIKNIENTYKKSVKVYENLLSLKDQGAKTGTLDALFSKSINYLSERNFASSEATLNELNVKIESEKTKIAAQFSIPPTAPSSNTPPGNGYSRQKVSSDVGDFLVDIVSGDLSSTKVIVDTASNESCRDNCPTLSLTDYVSRNNAYAGINGSYFCPAEYPSCAGKTNSFDTLLMNKNKTYFNSENNVYSTVPAVIFGGSFVRFVGRSLDWGRDTEIDSMIANQPLLLSDGNIVFGGDGDPKKGSKGTRSFVGNKDNKVYIGVVHNVTVAEMAHVLKALGLSNALNLDSGGSVALWSGGYKAGPGRNIPNAILFLRK